MEDTKVEQNSNPPGRPPGGQKFGGRKAGTVNKRTQEAIDLAKKLKVDPLEILLLITKGDWKALGYDSPTITKVTSEGFTVEVERIELDHRIKSAKEACNYIYPKRKSIEIKDEDGGPLARYLGMTPDERQKRILELERRNSK